MFFFFFLISIISYFCSRSFDLSRYTGGFGSALMTKDLGLAVEAAKTSGTALGLGAHAHQLYTLLSNSGYGDKDFSSVFEYLSKAPKKDQ